MKPGRAAALDRLAAAREMRIEAIGARAVNMPLTARVIDEYVRIAERAATVELQDPEPRPFVACACDDCVRYMWSRQRRMA